MASRYFATVRRAMFSPCAFSSSRELVVAQRIQRILGVDQRLQLLLDLLVGDLVAVGRADGIAEEMAEGKDAVVGLDVLAVHDAADGGDVHADDFGDVLVDHRPEPLARLEEVALLLDDRPHHLQHRLAALVDGADEPLRRLEPLPDEILGFGRRRRSSSAWTSAPCRPG